MKEGIYFPHFSSSRNDRKIKRLRKSLGIEGYAIFFMLLEVLREQEEFKYPTCDIDLLADDFDTTEDKVKVVIFNFDLFRIDKDDFFSPRLIDNLEPYLQGKQQKKIGGIKGNLLRHGHLTKDQLSSMTNIEIIDFNEKIKSDSGRLPIAMREHTDSHSGRLTSQKKEKEKKEKERKDIAHSENAITCFSFEEFYEAYGKKRDRKKSEQIYAKLNEVDRQMIKDTITTYVMINKDVEFRKYPATYLNGRNWEDDLTIQVKEEKKETVTPTENRNFRYS